ncbi:MAG: pyridoxamine 5'-phosphate oxidase family protein [Thermoplasmata archaeon]|nr:pyridoxamine 5'-phosphate oxidase family protein [Thermoplasmata archaeon]
MEPKMLKNQLTREQCLALLDSAGTGVLCLNGTDGWPYAVPVNFVRVGDILYYHGRKTGTRVDCMDADGRCRLVAFREGGYDDYGPDACDTTTAFESVVVKGTVSAIEDDEEKARVLRALTDKLTPAKRESPLAMDRVPRTGVFRITMDEVTGKHHDPKPDSRIHSPRDVVAFVAELTADGAELPVGAVHVLLNLL